MTTIDTASAHEQGSQPSRSSKRKKQLRFSTATLFGVASNLGLYAALLGLAGWSEPIANLAAAVTVSSIRFAINKFWVWEDRSTKRTGRQAAVHACLTAGGLVVSTAVANQLAIRDAALAVLLVGNVASFALFTVLKFVAGEVMFRQVLENSGELKSESSQPTQSLQEPEPSSPTHAWSARKGPESMTVGSSANR